MIQLDLNAASTLAVHISLVVGVAVYTLFGAVSMQYLESPERVRSAVKRSIVEKHRPITRVYLGSEVSEMDKGVHACIRYVISDIMNRTQCREDEINELSIGNIDSCYQFAKFNNMQAMVATASDPSDLTTTTEFPTTTMEAEIEAEVEKWSFGNALIFTFTVITTIGYGHVAPETFYGRLFCIVYGVIGVPLTLLTIADLGMFLSMCLKKVIQGIQFVVNLCKKCCVKKKVVKSPEIIVTDRDVILSTARDLNEEKEESEEPPEEEGEVRKTSESIALGVTFVIYLLVGAKILSAYEPEMDFFKATYFNFVTLTTIGLGDFVPKSFDYLYATLVYIGIGLALTTMAIEIAADLLKKVHYAGRKMENMANAAVWFGGKKMTMKNLVKYLGDQFDIDEADLANFNIDEFVDNAIKVEAGEIKTLRKPVEEEVKFRENRAVSYSNLRKSSESATLDYVDDRMSRPFEYPKALEVSKTERPVPALDLDVPFFTDSSLPTSFDEDYLKTFTFSKRTKNS